jgi:hypothetical protein
VHPVLAARGSAGRRLEEVIAVTKDGGRPLFSWGFAPLTGR